MYGISNCAVVGVAVDVGRGEAVEGGVLDAGAVAVTVVPMLVGAAWQPVANKASSPSSIA